MADPASCFLQDLSCLLRHCQRVSSQQSGFSSDELESCHRKLEYYLSLLEYIVQIDPGASHVATLVAEVRPWLVWLESLPVLISPCCTTLASVQQMSVHSGEIGRPSYSITSENLEFLRDAGFKWTEISKMFGVSRSTITRRVRDFDLQSSQMFTDISDADLQDVICEIHSSNVDAGCRMVRGILRSRGIHVTMPRVHQTLRAVDPIQSAQRWGAMVQRRTYRVKAANSLWHIDSHHSLIRWRFIIHGGKKCMLGGMGVGRIGLIQ